MRIRRAERNVHTFRDRYNLFGLTVASELALPLPPASGPPAIEVVHGSVRCGGEVLFQTDDPLPFSCSRQGDEIVLAWTGVRFRVARDQVVVDADDLPMATHLLVPAAWSVVLAAHKRESLHGAAVAHESGTAVAILGSSGNGKTTAAGELVHRGWRLVSDDLLTFDAGLRVVPGPPWTRHLPGDVATAGEPDVGGKRRVRQMTSPVPVPLSVIIILAPEHDRCIRLVGMSAVAALLQQLYNPMLTHPGQTRRRFELVSELAARVPIYGAPPRSLAAGQLLHILEETSV